MCKKLKVIMELSESSKKDEVIVYLESFKVKGKIHKDDLKEGVLTLRNAAICGCEADCTCMLEEDNVKFEWFNIYAKEILAFTLV